MKGQVVVLLLGIIAGLCLGLTGSYIIGQRYAITKEDSTLQTKMDRWTGKTWVMRWYVDEEGKYISPYWEPVSQQP